MTYLTVININETRPLWWKTENDLEALHAMVEKSVPNDSGRVLWRLDKDTGRNGDVLIIKSDTVPDATGIVEQFGWPRLAYDDQVKTADMSRFYGSLAEGQRFHFRIAVNPSKQDSSSKKRYPLVGRNALNWTTGKLENGGFIVHRIEQKAESSPRLMKNGRPIFVKTTHYIGVVEVADPVKAVKTLEDGIGRYKAYGDGLMTLTR